MSLIHRLRGDWPFAAARSPVFYGWVIAFLSTLGFLMSIPGQTMGMAVFADAFIDVTGLSRTQLSTAYLIGTLGSAFLLTHAGRWYDRYGARVMMFGASVLLGATLVFLAAIDLLAVSLAAVTSLDLVTVAFPLMVLGYFGVRFAGQGVLTSASRNVLLVWFVRRRGFVSGLRGVFVSLGFSIAPFLIALLMDATTWRGALLWMAVAVGVGFALIVLVWIRDHPGVSGLHPDGGAVRDSAEPTAAAEDDCTLAHARRDPVFWLYALSLSMHALFGTAVTFHIVAIFDAAGRSRAEAFAYFIPQAVVSLTVNLSASTLSDHMRLKPWLVIMLVAFLVGAFGLTRLTEDFGYYLLIAGFGAGGGLWGVLSNLAFIRHYGALHLGEISGFNTSLTVTASAIGPVAFALALDVFASFNAAAYACMSGLALLLLAAVVVPQPRDKAPVR
ncbi:MAG: MFS transporter [Pseudomonadota bacterium]